MKGENDQTSDHNEIAKQEVAPTMEKEKDMPQKESTDVEKPKSEEPTTGTNESGAWGWNFDVNTVADNIGGFFGNMTKDEESEPTLIPKEVPQEEDDDFGQKAASFANAATAELEIAGKAAQETIGKAAEEFGKGWGSLNTFLDDMLAAKPDSTALSEENVQEQFRKMFPQLGTEDEVVDHFQCVVLQKYRCYLNNATPEKVYKLQARLFVSTSTIAVYIADVDNEFGGKPFTVSIPFSDVAKIQKGAKAMLKVVTSEQISYIFAGFESDSHFSGALSLLEHMTAASVPQEDQSQEAEDKKEVMAT